MLYVKCSGMSTHLSIKADTTAFNTYAS